MLKKMRKYVHRSLSDNHSKHNHSSLIHNHSNLGAMSDIWEMSVCKEITTVALSDLKKFNNNSLITQNIKCLHLVLINAVFK